MNKQKILSRTKPQIKKDPSVEMSNLEAKDVFLIVLFLFLSKVNSKESPKYFVEIDRFEQCSEYPNLESPMENQTFYKINRTTRAFSFETDLIRPIDENIGLKAELERWTSSGWTKIPFMPLQPDACTLFHKLLGQLWTDLKRQMGVKEPEKCPIPPGHYGLKNYMYDTSNLGVFAPFKGKFRYKCILMDVKTKEAVQCINVVIDVTDP